MRGLGTARRWSRALARAVRRRSARGIVLLYHRVAGPRFDPLMLDVSPSTFADHLALLRTEATVLPLGEFEERRRAGRLPERAVAITFDDGYADNLLTAVPLLRAADLPATIFVTAGMVDGSGEFWWDDVERVAFAAHPLAGGMPESGISWMAEGSLPVHDPSWNIFAPGTHTPRQHLFLSLCEGLRSLPPAERDARVSALRRWAAVPARGRESHRAVTRAELRALAATPGITIGAHSLTHPVLSAQPAVVQREELAASRAQLAAWTGTPVSCAAYPFGMAGDVSATTVRAARAAGFRAACANVAGPAWRWSSAWRVPRYLVRDWDAELFARHLQRWWTE